MGVLVQPAVLNLYAMTYCCSCNHIKMPPLLLLPHFLNARILCFTCRTDSSETFSWGRDLLHAVCLTNIFCCRGSKSHMRKMHQWDKLTLWKSLQVVNQMSDVNDPCLSFNLSFSAGEPSPQKRLKIMFLRHNPSWKRNDASAHQSSCTYSSHTCPL